MSDAVDGVPDAVPARPWRREDGPWPVVWTWPPRDPPALWVRSGGQWRRGTVVAKQVWADGAVRYQVSVDLHGDTLHYMRLYRWPQPGLRAAHESGSKPSRGADERRQGNTRQA